MKKKTLLWVFFILMLITSIYGLNKSKTELNLGIFSCVGGQGGSSNFNINSNLVSMENTQINANGGNGGNCQNYFQNEKKLRIIELISLISLVISVVANSLFIYDYYSKK